MWLLHITWRFPLAVYISLNLELNLEKKDVHYAEKKQMVLSESVTRGRLPLQK